MRRPTRALALVAALALSACGGRGTEAEAPQQKLTAEAEVLGVSKVWQALEEEHGARGPNDKISVFDMKQRTTLSFQEG